LYFHDGAASNTLLIEAFSTIPSFVLYILLLLNMKKQGDTKKQRASQSLLVSSLVLMVQRKMPMKKEKEMKKHVKRRGLR